VFVAFLMSLCNPRFSATQYALLSSVFAVANFLLAAPTGAMAEAMGWPGFFLATVAAGVPGLLMLPLFVPWRAAVPVGAAKRDEGEAG
jgi:PAT family beta-lactamase induction signal transducer AmpG